MELKFSNVLLTEKSPSKGFLKLKKVLGSTLVAVAVATTFASPIVHGRQIGTISSFVVQTRNILQGQVRVNNTGLVKAVTGRRAVVNLSGNATGSPVFITNMRNANGANRGGVNIRHGERLTFDTPNAEAGFLYWLYMRTTSTASAANRTVSGSWSPDEN